MITHYWAVTKALLVGLTVLFVVDGYRRLNYRSLHYYSAVGTPEGVVMCLERGDDLGRVLESTTPLILASRRGHLDVCEVLLKSGADPNQAVWYDSPLAAAINSGHADIAFLLLDHGADPNRGIGIDELPPIVLAVTEGNANIAKRLVEEGANVGKVQKDHDLIALAKKVGAGPKMIIVLEEALAAHHKANPGKSAETE